MFYVLFCFCLICGYPGSASPQVWDAGSDSAITDEPKLYALLDIPADWQHWTPTAGQFNLYVNTDTLSGDTVPHIDILSDLQSWPFLMRLVGDTVYCYLVPPGYMLTERSTIDHLPLEFPFVICAGTDRAVYWFTYDSGRVSIDPLQSSEFLTIMHIQPLPDRVIYIQLPQSDNNSKHIVAVLQAVGSQGELVQLDEGFYQNIWYLVSQLTVRRYRVNETQLGTLVFIRVRDDARIDTVRQQLAGVSH